MKTTQSVYQWLTGLAVAVLAIGCSERQPTSPESATTVSPAFSFQSSSSRSGLFGTNGSGSLPSTLYTIDATTGVATAVGPIGFSGVGGIDFAADGTLYGIVGGPPVVGPTLLITIDPTTGTGTAVGLPAPGFNARFDISFRNGDGVLHATGWTVTGSGPIGLATINVSTGVPTVLGPTGNLHSGNGLAFSSADVLYQADKLSGGTLYTLNQTTGAGTAVAGLSFVGFSDACCLRLNALSFDPATDVLYASANGGGGGTGPQFLATVDPTTGVVTNIGQSVDGLDAIAWQPIAQTPAEAIESLIEEVTALIAASELTQGEGTSLLAKLNAALRRLNRSNGTTALAVAPQETNPGDVNAAISQLRAFINQVNAFVQSGSLTDEEGQSLIDAVQAIIDALVG